MCRLHEADIAGEIIDSGDWDYDYLCFPMEASVTTDDPRYGDALERDEVVRKLRDLEKLKMGEKHPEWLPSFNWGPIVSELCGRAADLIEGKNV